MGTNKSVSQGTVDALAALHESARAGDLIGVAFVAVKRGRKPVTGWAGEAGSNPFQTLGFIKRLEQRLLDHAEEMGY